MKARTPIINYVKLQEVSSVPVFVFLSLSLSLSHVVYFSLSLFLFLSICTMELLKQNWSEFLFCMAQIIINTTKLDLKSGTSETHHLFPSSLVKAWWCCWTELVSYQVTPHWGGSPTDMNSQTLLESPVLRRILNISWPPP